MGQAGQKYYKAEVIWRFLIGCLISLKAAGPEFFVFSITGCRTEKARQPVKYFF
jgi:hypothetical protein